MKIFLFVFIIGLLVDGGIYCFTTDLISAEATNRDHCGAYCFSMGKPLLDYLNQVKEQIDENNGMKIKIKELENQLRDKQIELKFRDELIKDLQTQRNSQIGIYEAQNCLPFVNSTDIHVINVPGIYPFRVPCDSEIAGSGWTVIQRRISDNVHFNRSWEQYRNGFGNLRENFFIGLEKLHLMTQNQPQELYILLRDVKGETRFARFNNFNVGSEEESFELKSVGEYSGTAGDHLSSLVNTKFSTFDRDNDKISENCAVTHNGGWWFDSCSKSSLNGMFYSDGVEKRVFGIYWGQWNTLLNYDPTSLVYVQMMIRPI